VSGLLFLLEVAAVVLIALWVWGVERPGEEWRVRIFDMRDQGAAEADASARSAPRWRSLKPGAETPLPEGRPPTSFRRAPVTPSSTRPRWRRSI
jgi:hypothetical protein